MFFGAWLGYLWETILLMDTSAPPDCVLPPSSLKTMDLVTVDGQLPVLRCKEGFSSLGVVKLGSCERGHWIWPGSSNLYITHGKCVPSLLKKKAKYGTWGECNMDPEYPRVKECWKTRDITPDAKQEMLKACEEELGYPSSECEELDKLLSLDWKKCPLPKLRMGSPHHLDSYTC